MAIQVGADSTTDSPAGSRVAAPGLERHGLISSDPVPVGLALFAFALAVYGARFVSVSDSTLAAGPITIGLNYAVLVAAIGESVCGILAVLRGQAYPGYVLSIFGIWLWGFFFLITAGAGNKEFTPDALAWYAFFLDIPVVIMAVPAVVHRNVPFIVAFAGLILLVLFLGLGYHALYDAITTATATKTPPHLSGAVSLLKVSAYCGFVASAALFWTFAVDTYRTTGVLRTT